eukprot:1866101-Pleurochrysis_carterae.AAC.1
MQCRNINKIFYALYTFKVPAPDMNMCYQLGRLDLVASADSQILRHPAKATYSPLFSLGRVATGWPHLYIIVHPNINRLPGR